MSYINSCVICTCDFKLNDNVTTLQCGHAYHTDCILQWLAEHSTCPFCRQNVASWDSTFSMKLSGFYDIQETVSPSDEVLKLKEIIRNQNTAIETMRGYVTKCQEAEEKYEILKKKFKRRRKARFFNVIKPTSVRFQ